jgi:hypothetical protein
VRAIILCENAPASAFPVATRLELVHRSCCRELQLIKTIFCLNDWEEALIQSCRPRSRAVKTFQVLVLIFLLSCNLVSAGEVDVLQVKVKRSGDNIYSFDVTVTHNDEGWEHYANKWDVVAPDGTILGTRILYHPHVQEQPFTRSLSGVTIPEGVTGVTIRAHDSVHGYGGKVMTVDLLQ